MGDTGAAVETWFGEAFAELHPFLQRLHRLGGTLSGPVEVSFGRGLGGALGRRLASRMGVPVRGGRHRLQVRIGSQDGVLHWQRRFDGRDNFDSTFEPVGRYPSGFWVERSGPLTLELGVEIRDGGWHWRHRRTRWLGVSLPRTLLPQTLASKYVEDGGYRFSVEIRAPLLGKLLGYTGRLTAWFPADTDRMSEPCDFEVLKGLPPYGPPARQFSLTGTGLHSEGYVVRFFPAGGEPWVGNFQPGLTSLYQVLPHPVAPHLLVISGGTAYVVHPGRADCADIFGDNIHHVIELPDERAIVLGNFLWFERVDEAGPGWRSAQISWDGVRNVRVADGKLLGESWMFDDTWWPFEIDLRTGEARGGAYNGPE